MNTAATHWQNERGTQAGAARLPISLYVADLRSATVNHEGGVRTAGAGMRPGVPATCGGHHFVHAAVDLIYLELP